MRTSSLTVLQHLYLLFPFFYSLPVTPRDWTFFLVNRFHYKLHSLTVLSLFSRWLKFEYFLMSFPNQNSFLLLVCILLYVTLADFIIPISCPLSVCLLLDHCFVTQSLWANSSLQLKTDSYILALPTTLPLQVSH